jgi:hypothetical protein
MVAGCPVLRPGSSRPDRRSDRSSWADVAGSSRAGLEPHWHRARVRGVTAVSAPVRLPLRPGHPDPLLLTAPSPVSPHLRRARCSGGSGCQCGHVGARPERRRQARRARAASRRLAPIRGAAGRRLRGASTRRGRVVGIAQFARGLSRPSRAVSVRSRVVRGILAALPVVVLLVLVVVRLTRRG